MPLQARDTSLKLRPDIAEQLSRRVASLNLTLSAYVAVLIWNQARAPERLTALEESPQLARVNVPCYFRRAVAPLLKRIAADAKLSENAAAEALIARDLRTPNAPLVIMPRL